MNCKLPELNEGQEWCCSKGCGPCQPVQYDFEYSRTETLDGVLIDSKTEKVWVSHCCKAELELWDEKQNTFVEVKMICHGCGECRPDALEGYPC